MSLNKNQLFYGDNYEVLQKYIKDESIDLVYIDPPFNSKRNYNQIYNNIGTEDKAQAQAFVDTWEWNFRAEKDLKEILYSNSFTPQTKDLIIGLEKVLKKGTLLAYLTSMTLRINEMWRVLKPTGSFYLHCDTTASHYLKLLCDAIFTSRGGEFINEIVWCYATPSGASKRFGRKHDIIMSFSKSSEYTFNIQRIGHKSGLHNTGQVWNKKSKDKEKKEIEKLEEAGKKLEDWWVDIYPVDRVRRERLGYPTQKPLALLERIILASSNEGDTILDAYCGCGTTVHASQKLNRNWVGIDDGEIAIETTKKRLENVNYEFIEYKETILCH